MYVAAEKKKNLLFNLKNCCFLDFLLDSFVFGKTQNETELAQKWFKLSLYIWIDGISNWGNKPALYGKMTCKSDLILSFVMKSETMTIPMSWQLPLPLN